MFRYGFHWERLGNIYSHAWRSVIIPVKILRATVITPTLTLGDMQGLRDHWFELLAVAVISLALFLIVVIVTS